MVFKVIVKLKSILGVSGLALISNIATAEVIFYDIPQVGVVSPKAFINKSNGLKVGVSAGLDRKTELHLKTSSGLDIYRESSNYITVNDRIKNPLGNDFYGHVFALPSLRADIEYELTQNVYDKDDLLIKTESSKLTIDTSGATLTSLNVQHPNNTYNPPRWVHNGKRVLSIREVNQIDANFEIEGAGIDTAKYTVFEQQGNEWVLHGEYDATISGHLAILQNANHSGAYYGVRGKFPSYSSDVKVELKVVDTAGNSATTSSEFHWVTCNFDKDTPNSKHINQIQRAIGITDPSSSGIPGVPNSAGYRAFTPGDLIPHNPLSIILKVPIELSRYADPVKGYGLGYGRYDITESPLSVDNKYAYYATANKVPTSNGTLIGQRVNTGELCTGYLNIGSNFTAESAPPRILGATITFDNKDTFEVEGPLNEHEKQLRSKLPPGNYYYAMTGLQSGWSELSNVNVRVKPQAYNQIVSAGYGPQKCTVKAGDDNCTINYNIKLKDIDGKMIHTNYGITSYRENSANHGSFTLIYKVDLTPPRIEEMNIDQTNKTVSGLIWNHEGPNHYVDFRIATAFIEAKNVHTGDIHTIKGQVANYTVPHFTFNASLESLPDGEFTLDVVAYDSAGNSARKIIGTVKADNSSPVITINNKNDALLNNDIVKGLESLNIQLTDASNSQIKSVTIVGGPANDKLKLDWVGTGNNEYKLEYPRLFPSLQEGESYTLSIEAIDEYGNESVKSMIMRYVPANVVTLKAGRLLTTNKLLLNRGDEPLYQIVSTPLRGNDGQLISGKIPVVFTLRSDSEFSINILERTIAPGETHEWDFDLSSNDGRIYLPVIPAEKSLEGTANFMFEILNVTTTE